MKALFKLSRHVLLGAAFFLAAAAHAQVDFLFSDAPATTGVPENWKKTDSIADHLTVSTGWHRGNTTEMIYSVGVGANPVQTYLSSGINKSYHQTGLVGAVSHNHYLGFTLSVADGYSLDLSTASISYDFTSMGTGGASGMGPQSFAITLGTDDFATNFTPDSPAWTVGGSSKTVSGTLELADFVTGSSLAAITEPLEVRIYLWGSTGSVSNKAFNLNDFSITGGAVNTTAVPEPATYAAILGGLTLILAFWRRRRAAARA